ncbi:MAG: sterol desaturase family protein [Rhodobacteraceae bacterium]|nr:sterol desaturase family protein [Paracoccaceae bacterium]
MEQEGIVRLSIFFGLFIVFAAIEYFFPRRVVAKSKARRWLTNWSVSVFNVLTLRLFSLALPLLAIGAAFDAQNLGIGLFNQIGFSVWIEIIMVILILDFCIWLQHLLTHKIGFLWRIHRVHHSDTEMDISTAIRFHPIEIALSMALKIGLVYILGADPLSVLIFEILLNGSSIFNHANINIPNRFDKILRFLIVTPDMHRIHHSSDRIEHDTNFGFALSIWDHIFRTYKLRPERNHTEMEIGLNWQDEKPEKLSWSLSLPFKKNG